MHAIAYLTARVVLGTSMLGHGLVRLPKLGAFSDWMVQTFEKSPMPIALVRPFSLTLPVIEFVVGLLLVTGLFTQKALVAGAAVMVALIFGSCLIENWEWVSFQMFYGLFFALLLAHLNHNHYALDRVLKLQHQ